MSAIKKTAIVTGASKGIGASLVQHFLDKNYNVIANSRHITKTSPFSTSSNLVLVEGDIGSAQTAKQITQAALSHFGRIDTLVNNAGILIAKPFTEYTAEDLAQLNSTITFGFFHITQHAIKQMLQQKSGHIVNISTTIVDQPVADAAASLQAMIKGGLNAVTRALAIEYATQGIRVNTVSPGAIDTPMHKPESHGFLNSLQPMGKMGTTKDIADAVLYLDNAPFITGEIIRVDGGAHAGKW